MCDCILTIPKKLEKHLVENSVILSEKPEFKELGLSLLDDEMKVKTYSTVTYEEKKTAKNGNVRYIKKKKSIVHSYCPFCGEKQAIEKQK